MQHAFGLREKLAFALGIPESHVNVIKPGYIGGGFGGKLDIGFIEPIASLLSLKTGKPVRAEHTRGEDFISTTRNPIKVYLKTGVKKEGTFTARLIRSVLDCGAHATHGAEVIMVHGLYGTFFPWKCANQTWEGFTVYTNNMIGGGYRGWYPQQYDSVAVDVASYFTWTIDLKAKLFKFLTLRRGYYNARLSFVGLSAKT